MKVSAAGGGLCFIKAVTDSLQKQFLCRSLNNDYRNLLLTAQNIIMLQHIVGGKNIKNYSHDKL